MERFFDQSGEKSTVTHGTATFELPIFYQRDDVFTLYCTANLKKIKAAMPSDNLYPVALPGGRAIIVFAAFNYLKTTIGSYGELAVAVPAVYGKKITVLNSVLPALMESSYPGFGLVVLHLPVTKVVARDAGRGEWGYTKFLANMNFSFNPEYLECNLLEKSEHILDIRVARKGFFLRDNRPLTTYSVKNKTLIKTVIPQTATKRISLFPGKSFVKFGKHPVAESIKELGVSTKPIMSVYYPERAGILPAGSVVEEGVRPMNGHIGEVYDAVHNIDYR
jgi:hypothetical protein